MTDIPYRTALIVCAGSGISASVARPGLFAVEAQRLHHRRVAEAEQ
jgi:hypothetical protein